MAIVKNIFCTRCKKEKEVCRSLNDYSSICDECRGNLAQEEYKKHREKCESMSIEERIKAVEDYIYYQPKKRPLAPYDMIG